MMKNILCTFFAISGLLISNFLECHSSSNNASLDEKIWLSIGKDAFDLINQKYSTSIQLTNKLKDNAANKEVAIIQIARSEVNHISQLMHLNFNRCPGFVVHESQFEAEVFNNNFKLLKSTKIIDYTLDNANVVNELLSQLSISNLDSTVAALSDFNNRYYNATSGVSASTWIKEHWENISFGRDDISVDFFEHNDWLQPSVITTIEGTTKRDEIVIIGGHLDSVNWRGTPATARAPGSDDNASGIAVITEALTAIVSSGYRPERTVKIIGYAAEEVGLLGSKSIAFDFAANELNVVGVAQFDMTGFRGTNNQDIVFITDYTNAEQNQFMASLISNYLSGVTYGFDVCGYGCSDHAAWNNLGYPASFPFESRFGDNNKNIHTANDDDFDSAHAIKFAKLSVAYLAELAKGSTINQDPLIASIGFVVAKTDVNEGSSVTIIVRRGNNFDDPVSIDFATSNGTAIAGNDYTATSGTLNWDSQDNSDKSIIISTNEVAANKTFSVTLSNPSSNSQLGVNSKVRVEISNLNQISNSGGGGTLNYLLVLLGLLSLNRKNKFN